MRRTVTLSASVLAAAGLAACGVVDREPNLIAGKRAFVEKCGSCHVLERAGTKGNQGPNLDEAFRQSLDDGMKRSTIEGVVHRQILQPNRRPQQDPETGKELIAMPAKLVKGDLALDVSSYVASVSAKSGDDEGRLADIGTAKAKGNAVEKNGVIEIDTDPSGQLAYLFASATAKPGALEIKSVNKSATGHNIAIEGNGVDQKGPIVSGGGSSDIKVDLKPGDYTFYCSVPGHREGGMEGKLTVKA
jgi:plastocyanin/cytochrome c2